MANYQLTQTGAEVQAILDKAETPDTAPTSGSTGLVTSGGVKTALDNLGTSLSAEVTALGQEVGGETKTASTAISASGGENVFISGLNIPKGSLFKLRVSYTISWTRIILYCNNQQVIRLYDSDTNVINGEWVEFAAPADLVSLGYYIGISSPGTLTMEVIAEPGVKGELDYKVDEIVEKYQNASIAENVGAISGGEHVIPLDLSDTELWEYGDLNGGAGTEIASTSAVRTPYIKHPQGVLRTIISAGKTILFSPFFYDDNDTYIVYNRSLHWPEYVNLGTLLKSVSGATKMRLVLRYDDNSTIGSLSEILNRITFSGLAEYTQNENAAPAIDGITSKIGDNLFNPDDDRVLVGYYINGGAAGPGASYNASGYIPVTAGTTYYKASNSSSDFRFVCYYDSDKKYLSQDSNVGSFTPPVNCAFVRVTFFASAYATAQVATSSIPYVPYGKTLSLVGSMGTEAKSIATKGYVDNAIASNILLGKKYVACGDSFTRGGYNSTDGFPASDYKYSDGPYAGEQIVYPYIIGLRNQMRVVNLAVGGMTMCDVNGNTDNSFTHGVSPVYQNIPADADYVTLKFGINDGTDHLGSPIGTIDDEVVTTFYGAWNVVLKWLRDNRPFAHVGIIITNGGQQAYTDATRAVAKKWGVPYLDEVNDPEVPLLIRANRPEVSDYVKTKITQQFAVNYTATAEHPNVNLHPNTDAQYYESTFVEDFLRRL